MEETTPQEFLEKTLPKRFNPSKAAGINVIVHIAITGPNGGEWAITIKDQKLEVKKESPTSPNLSLKMTEKDYMDLINKKISAEKAFFTGKIKFKGDIALALKLREAGFL